MLRRSSFTPDTVQGLEAFGTVTARDYADVFVPLIRETHQRDHRLRLLYQFGPDFHRLTVGALWADGRAGFAYAPLLDGCAIVSDIKWIREPSRQLGAWMPCPVRVYGNDERDEAGSWLASLPSMDTASAPQLAKAYLGGSVAAAASVGKLILSGDVKIAGRHR